VLETIVSSFGLGTWVDLRLHGEIHDRTKAKRKETFDASPNFAFVPVLLGAVAREHLPDRAAVAVVGRDEALAHAPIHIGWRGLG